MNRKDTIIIAAVINAALLLVLFVSAKTTDVEIFESKVEVLPIKEVEKKPLMAQANEIEEILKGFSEEKKDELPAERSDFSKQLQAITELHLQEKPPLESKGWVKVVVKKGDTLEKLAKDHGDAIDEISKRNQLKSTVLQVGQSLKLCQKGQTAESSAKTYTVRAGDNPWSIALKNHMKLEDLLKLNQLNEEKARHLKPGDKLLIR